MEERAKPDTPVVIRALEEWRHFLEGTEHRFEIWTDHKNLEYFMKAKKLNCRQARWSLFLACFNSVMHHQPGKSMGKTDTLSQQADHGSGTKDNEDIVLLTPDFFTVCALEGVELVGEEQDILKEIRREVDRGETEEAVARAVNELRKTSACSI